MDAKGHTRAVETDGRRSLDELFTKREHICNAVEREEEAHEVEVRTKARGET